MQPDIYTYAFLSHSLYLLDVLAPLVPQVSVASLSPHIHPQSDKPLIPRISERHCEMDRPRLE